MRGEDAHAMRVAQQPPQRPIDTLITTLCSQLVAQREQYAALAALAQSRGDDCESYRLLAKQTIEALHREQAAHSKLRDRYERIVIENRELRIRYQVTTGGHLPSRAA